MTYRIAMGFILGILMLAETSLASDAASLKCQSVAESGSTISYVITRDGGRYEVSKFLDDVKVGSVELPLSGGVEGYGGTHLYFRNLGRSGYLLIYSHAPLTDGGRSRALIDINLFQAEQRALNTRGPESGFECGAT